MLYLVVFAANILHSESTSFTSMGQTREASARWAVLRSMKRLEFVSAKRVQTPLQGVCTTIERTDVGSSPTVTTTNPVGVQVQRLPDYFAYSSRVRTFLSEGYAKRVRKSSENCVPLEATRSHQPMTVSPHNFRFSLQTSVPTNWNC